MNFFTYSYAPSTANTLVGVVKDCLVSSRVVADRLRITGLIQELIAYLIFVSISLKFAVAVLIARGAVASVLIAQKLHDGLSRLVDFVTVGVHDHPRSDLKRACGDRILLTLDFDKTHSA